MNLGGVPSDVRDAIYSLGKDEKMLLILGLIDESFDETIEKIEALDMKPNILPALRICFISGTKNQLIQVIELDGVTMVDIDREVELIW